MLPLVRGCANLDCSCHTAPPTPNTGTEWEERFDERFGLYNELDCKPFIRSLLATQKSHLIAEVEAEKYADDEEDLGAEAIAEHAYKDKFEAFRYGYNEACNHFITKLKEV